MTVQFRPHLKGALLVAGLAATATLAASPRLHGGPSGGPDGGPDGGRNVASAAEGRARTAYGRLPLTFEENRGQAESNVRFLAQGHGYSLSLHPEGADLSLAKGKPGQRKSEQVRMRFVGSRRATSVKGKSPLGSRVNYLIGKDRSAWRSDLPTYAQVQYRDVYPGVDMLYYGRGQELEYDFVVKPGADPDAIALSFDGAEQIRVDESGDLVLKLKEGEIRQHRPVVYQEAEGKRQEIDGAYRMAKDGTVRFALAQYDASRPLVIDPTLAFSTYLGGTQRDEGLAITVDAAGFAYVTGYTGSVNFRKTAGAFQGNPADGVNAFVSKLNPAGNALVFSTYLGGDGDDYGTGIRIFENPNDGLTHTVVSGWTLSTNFPTTRKNAFQVNDPDLVTNPDGSVLSNKSDAFVTELNALGSVPLYSSYFGGTGDDAAYGLAIRLITGTADPDGYALHAYLGGQTQSTDLPVTTEAFQDALASATGDAFVGILNTKQLYDTSLVFSTYLGGGRVDTINGIDVDARGAAYVVGTTRSTDFPTTVGALQDTGDEVGIAFASKLNPFDPAPPAPSIGGPQARVQTLVYSTYIGSPSDGIGESGNAVDVDGAGRVYLVGSTGSPNFPVTPNAIQPAIKRDFSQNPAGNPTVDAFLVVLDVEGASLAYSTFFGGNGVESANGVAVDAAGIAHITGTATSLDLPTRFSLFPPKANRGQALADIFVATIDPAGTPQTGLSFSSYIGSPGHEIGRAIAVDGNGNDYITGYAGFNLYPTTRGSLDASYNGNGDAFVTKISRLEIRDIDVSKRSPTSATIYWRTTQPTTSRVKYGLTSAYGLIAESDALTTLHDVTLTGLTPFTEYHFQVSGTSVDGYTVVSDDRTFLTSQDGSPVLSFRTRSQFNDQRNAVRVFVTFINDGPGDITDIQITGAPIRVNNKTFRPVSPLPVDVGALIEDGTREIRLSYRKELAPSGKVGNLTLEGTYNGASFSRVLKVRLP